MEEIKYGIVSIDEYDYSFNYDANLENMDISAVRYRLSHHLRPNKEKNQIKSAVFDQETARTMFVNQE